MRQILFAFLLASTQAFGAIAYVNSARCNTTSSCATTWSVTSGNVLVVGRFANASGGFGGTLSDAQGNAYTQIELVNNASDSRTAIHGTVLTSGGSAVTVSSTVTEQNLVLAEFSGVTLTTNGTPAGFAAGNNVCGSPLSITTTVDTLLLSAWSNNTVGGASPTCTATSGTLVATGQCGGTATGQIMYQIASPGTYTQKFTYTPDFATGNTTCGLSAIAAIAASGGKRRGVIIQ